MNILLVGDRFWPSVGGVQTVTRLLGQALVRAGHEVRVVTREQGNGTGVRGLSVERCLGSASLLKRYSWADTVVLQGLTVRLGWPLCLIPRPALVVHHTMPVQPAGDRAWRMRGRLARQVQHATVSKFIASQLGWALEAVLPNPYDDQVFRPNEGITHTRDIVFVGRLIPEKGAHVLIEALQRLRRAPREFTATVVGAGPEQVHLAQRVASAGLEDCVRFAGEVAGAALAKLLNQHRLLVVPSVYAEPFGIVALEGIACGCVVVGSDSGGLPEAIGRCGTIFPKGDSAALASKLEGLLLEPEHSHRFHTHAQQHVSKHRPETVAQRYLELLVRYAGAGRRTKRLAGEFCALS